MDFLKCLLRWRLLVWVLLLAGRLAAEVEVEGWYHLSDNAFPQDVSGHQRHFRGPLPGYTYPSEDAAGGPLGASGYTSMASLEFGRDAVSGYWGIGTSLPGDNVGIEAWVKPYGDGWINPSHQKYAVILATGGNSGLSIGVSEQEGKMVMTGAIINKALVGAPVPLNANHWTHLALVRDRGLAQFYVNGVASGEPSTVVPDVVKEVHLGSNYEGKAGFKGLIDEARIFTFAPGRFQVDDLLTRRHDGPGGQGEVEDVPLSNYQIKTWQSDSGLPNNTVTAINQTTDGYLWVGTLGGLARFDGGEFKTFRSIDTPALGSGRIRSLSSGRGGALWITTLEGTLLRHAAGEFKVLSLPPGADQSARFVRAEEDDEGLLWLSTTAGEIASWDGAHYKVVGGGPADRMELREGVSGFPVVISKDFIQHPIKDRLYAKVKTTAMFLCSGADGSKWFLKSDGMVLRLSHDGKTVSTKSNLPSPLAIRHACEDRTGSVWLATNEGVMRKDIRGGRLTLTARDGLGSRDARVVFEDNGGAIWIGMNGGGLSRLNPPLVTSFGTAQDLPDGRIAGLLADRDNTLWAGVEGTGLCQFHGIPPRLAEGSGAALNSTSVMVRMPDGTLYAGSRNGGLWMKRDGDLQREPLNPAESRRVCSLMADAENRLWLGGYQVKRVIRFDPDKITHFDFPIEIGAADVCSMALDGAGDLWAGTDGQGLLYFHQGTCKRFTRADGLNSDIIWSLLAEDDGSMWVGTFGGGLSRVKDGRIHNCSTRDGLENDTITHIENDGRGSLWCGSHQGVFRVRKDDLIDFFEGRRQRIRCVPYGLADGMPSLECSGGFQPAGCQTADGRLWFPTLKGVAMINPSAIRPDPLPPPVQVDGITVDGEFHPLASNVESPLAFSTGHLRYRFHYAGVEFTAPEALRYRIMLEGVDSDWLDARRERIADYSQLKAGHYVFRVQGCSRDGVWSQPGAALTININPQWHERTAVRITALLVLTGGSAAFIWWLFRFRMRRRLAAIEQDRMLEVERQRIASNIHDDLGASLTRIALLSDLARDGARAGGVGEEVEQIHDTANELTRAMDEIVWAVDPEHDSLDSLASYLARVAQDLLGPTGMRCRLAIAADLPDVMLAGQIRHNLYLAVKEALHNAIRHSGASEVKLSLELEPAAFSVIVRDNGQGIGQRQAEAGRASSGHGMKNLASRMIEIGGTCAVASTPGEGTEIILRVPFKTAACHQK